MKNAINYFKQITKIPRPSKKEELIRKFLINWSIENNYPYIVDKVGNLVVYTPAKNSDSIIPVILQSHMDMVCVKSDNSTHDFLKDPIKIIEKDGFLATEGTTLGADNGIGIALSLAATNFKSHPPLELLFTVDEEQGMSGALNFDGSIMNGKKLINLDSESEKEIYISSAGGRSLYIQKNLEYINSDNAKYKLILTGLKGGHSGVEIHKNHGNVVDIFIKFLSKTNLITEIFTFNSGIAENVIPSNIEIIISTEDLDKLKQELTEFISEIKLIHDCPDFTFNIEPTKFIGDAIVDGTNILKQIGEIKVGVYKMSEKIPGLTETSMNLGVIKIIDDKINFIYSIRSSINIELDKLLNSVKQYYDNLGYTTRVGSGYPGWQDDPDGELVTLAKEEMKKVIGTEPQIIAVHAGLECGALVSALGEGTSAISIGPNMFDIHSVNERVEIASVERMENVLEGILGRL